MSRLALFAIPLALTVAGVSHAQETPVASPTQVSTTSPAPLPALTPRQAAEMHADILMARKEYTEAINAYSQILSTEPKNAVLLNKTGVACQQFGDLNRAGRFYRKSMKADKTYASAVNNLGTVEYEKKHYGNSITLYKKALALHTDMSTIYSNLGYAYFGNKEYPEAMESFRKALEIDPLVFERRSGTGTIVQQRTTTDPGLFYFFVAKSYAGIGDAERTAHYLKLARDDGYKNFLSAAQDPAFAKVIRDPRVQEVLQVPPSYAGDAKTPPTN
ncbi:MAG: tetratricopeptide repeat protein [Candidatus Acidiferrales bacterium]